MIKRVICPVDPLKFKLQPQTSMDRQQTSFILKFLFFLYDEYRADHSSAWKDRNKKVTFFKKKENYAVSSVIISMVMKL